MTPLEAKITALLVYCEKILEPTTVTAQKWVIVSKTKNELKEILDDKGGLSYSLFRSMKEIRPLPSFNFAKAAYERDRVFSEALKNKTAGYWATFDPVLNHLVSNSGKIGKRAVSIDYSKALQCLKTFRKQLTSKHLEYQATARLCGVKMQCKSLALPDGVKLYRLNRKELNDKQPVTLNIGLLSEDDHERHRHPAELRVSITVPVDLSQESAFFKANNDAKQVATKIFTKILHAILIISRGRANLSYIELKGGLEQISGGRSISKEFLPTANLNLGSGDLANIEIAYELVSGGKRGDKILDRALHRFILGRQRLDLVDKLVDYVIAWEAILLTQEGNPILQELSYRFALNGAVLLSNIKKNISSRELFKKMRSAYATRSSTVHGGEDKERDKKLKIGDFGNLAQLCNFLEESFCLIVIKLASIKPKDRPYRKTEGWEALILSKNQ